MKDENNIKELQNKYKDYMNTISDMQVFLQQKAAEQGKVFDITTGEFKEVDSPENVLVMEVTFQIGVKGEDTSGLVHGFEPIYKYEKDSLKSLLAKVESESIYYHECLDFISNLLSDAEEEEYESTENLKNLICLLDYALVDTFEINEIFYNSKNSVDLMYVSDREGLAQKYCEILISSADWRSCSFVGCFSLFEVKKEYYDKVLSKVNQYSLVEKYLCMDAPYEYAIDN